MRAGVASLGALPSETTVVAERFFDEGGGMQLVLHAPSAKRINRAWGLSLRKRFCRTFNFELQAAATDNGILISLTEGHAFPLELVFEFLKPQLSNTCSHRRCSIPRCSPRAGAGTHRAPWRSCVSAAAARFPRLFSACALTICWPPFSPIRWPARKISPAKFAFPIIRWCAKPRQLPARSHGSRWPAAASRSDRRRRNPHCGNRKPRTIAVFA